MTRPRRLLSLALAAAGWAYAQSDATELLRDVAQNYKRLTTYRIQSVSESILKSEFQHSWQKQETSIAVDKGDKVRFESKSNPGAYLMVCNGKTLWRATPNLREWSKTGLEGPLAEVKGGGSEAEMAIRSMRRAMDPFSYALRDVKRAEVIGKESVEVDGAPVECTVVRADYDAPGGAPRIRSIVRTFWIDTRRRLIIQDETITRGALFHDAPFGDVESISRNKVTFAEVGKPLSPDLFAWAAPANFREMDKLEPPYGRLDVSLVGKPAPELSLKTLEGQEMKLASLRGKVVLLDFWATWCEPCRNQMPALAKLNAEFAGQDAVLLGVDDDAKPETALKFLRENHYDWQSLFGGPDSDARRKYSVQGIPTLVLIDRNGVVADYQVGRGEVTDKAIRAALGKVGIRLGN